MKRMCTIVLSTAALALGSAAHAQEAQKPEAKPEARTGSDCSGMQGKHGKHEGHGKHERHGKQEKHDHS
jgi:hypothetical protein